MGEALVPVLVAFLGGLAMVVAAILTRRTGTEERGLATLEAALRWQGGRISALEAEVASCETGRSADRERHDAEMDEMRDTIRRLVEHIPAAGGAADIEEGHHGHDP